MNRFAPAQKKAPGSILATLGVLAVAALLLIMVFFLFVSFVLPGMLQPCVAVVDINTELTTEGIPSSMFSEGVMGSDEIAQSIKELDQRPDVGAVVFVINSGGGSIVATREIYDAINGMEKPKVSYFREVAASGGYYIATPSDYIISEPYALTGSIGVVATVVEMSGLFEMVGINATNIVTGENKDIGAPNKELTDEQRAILQVMVNQAFEDFKSRIIEHRGSKLKMQAFGEILDARPLTGLQAKDIGLVDEVGSKQDAVNKAAELAGIEGEPRICSISFSVEQKGLFEVSADFFRMFSAKTDRNIYLNLK